ncbi:response regulator [Marinobacter sp. SS8-8]|uniref:response regulator n=1 Tax=Marinobacter sp. SS8-8 TaxID=3050452 RepID=UPI0026E0EE30|nr:response regulator [Marinobacter sp. SS8-8]
MSARPIPILMAEDDAMDRLLTEEALREGRLNNPLSFVEDGVQLMAYLRNQPPFEDAATYPEPGIILLDLNMPKKDGRTCLEEIQQDPALKHIPVVVMTTSTQEEEVFRSYDLGANSFICKPVDFDKLVSLMKTFNNYWFSIVELPREHK